MCTAVDGEKKLYQVGVKVKVALGRLPTGRDGQNQGVFAHVGFKEQLVILLSYCSYAAQPGRTARFGGDASPVCGVLFARARSSSKPANSRYPFVCACVRACACRSIVTASGPHYRGGSSGGRPPSDRKGGRHPDLSGGSILGAVCDDLPELQENAGQVRLKGSVCFLESFSS